MIQLVINGITLPETSGGKYQCYPAPLTQQIEMANGRLVQEVRGTVQKISYAYDYFPDGAAFRSLLAALRGGSALTVQYLPDDGSSLISSSFLCTSIKNPVFAFSRHGLPYWHDFSFELREVRPHD